MWSSTFNSIWNNNQQIYTPDTVVRTKNTLINKPGQNYKKTKVIVVSERCKNQKVINEQKF